MSEEEQKRLLRLGNLVLADYVRSMIDLLISNLDENYLKLTETTQKIF